MSDSKKKEELEDIFVDFGEDLDQTTRDYYEDMGIKIVEPLPEETEAEKEKRAVIDLSAYCKKDITTILVPVVAENQPTTYYAKNIDDATSDEVIAWAKYAIPSLQLTGITLNGKKDKVTLFETVITYLVSMKSSWRNTGAKALR